MWICPRCHTENNENLSVCESCGTARSAGRFTSPAMQGVSRAPRISNAPAQIDMRRPAPAYQPPDTNMPPAKPPRRPLQSFARVIGILLLLFLPLTTILTFVFLYETLSTGMIPLLMGADAAPGWQAIGCIGLGIPALLLSLLPGLWTLLLCEPRPPKYRRAKK